MDNNQEIEQLVTKYTQVIHSQEKEDLYAIWTNEPINTLISGSHRFNGIDCIYSDFLIGGIQNAYTKIDLIIDDTTINYIDDTLAIVILAYHTDCIRRETFEKYGIEGLETQVVKKTSNGWKFVHIQYHGKEIQQEGNNA